MLFPHPLALVTIGAVSAFLAKKRGKNPVLWFFLGMLFGIFGLIFLFFSRPTPSRSPRAQAQPKNDPNTIDITPKVDSAAKETFWYYLDPDNTQQGPMSFDGLVRAFREGKLSGNTYVWNETLDNWKPLSEFL